MALEIAGQVVDALLLSKISEPIGSVKQSMLTEGQFNIQNLGEWMLMDGRSCLSTEYETITSETSVPDLVTEGLFPRQAKAGRTKGTPEGDAIRNITGNFNSGQYHGYLNLTGAFEYVGVDSHGYGNDNNSAIVKFDASRQVPTASENRPKNVALNFFIKVNH
jgi:hypothetical protein